MQAQRQSLVQQQKLSLTPQLVQSIKLMGLPFAELRDRILEEVEKNPALEVVSDPMDGAEWAKQADNEARVSKEAEADWSSSADWREAAGGEEASDEHQDFIEGGLHRGETLQEHLLESLAETDAPARVRSLASLIIQNLDADGFHAAPPIDLPGADDPALLAEALDCVRGLDPVGCACVDFRESLAVQARLLAGARPLEDDPLLAKTVFVLERHFDFLEKGRPDALVKAAQKSADPDIAIDIDEAEGIFEIIRSLDPFPGRAYDRAPESWVAPDVIVRKTDGEFSVVINDEEIPVVGLSPFFMSLDAAPGEEAPKEARDFARESVKEAQWFIHTIERRNRTILKLARAILVFQREFFLHGPAKIAPLRMKDVAEEIGMHEATVSRAANGKYLQCEWGLFELKFFFSNQVGASPSGASSSENFSKQGVKEIVREIIEGASEPLSDQRISDILAARGVKIARRTVAKYRNELKLGSSFDR